MSSLRRRAIVVSRARSPERSSTGGRVSARAAAAESSGSASTRSQAIASRTSGRWKSAVGPERWKGMPRSSIAAATAPPCLAGSATRTQICSGAGPPAIRCSTSRATACAWARSLAHRQKPSRGSRQRCSSGSAPLGVHRVEPALGRGRLGAALQREDLAGVVGGERFDDRELRPASPPRARRPSAWRKRSAISRRTSGRSTSRQSGRGRRRPVEAAGLGEDAVVGGVELGELELAAGRLALGLVGGLGRPGLGALRRGWSDRPARPSGGRSGPAGGPAGRPGCRGSRGGAAAARRAGRAASPAVPPGRGRRRTGRARPPRGNRGAAARRSPPRCRSRAPRRSPSAAPRSVPAGARRRPGAKRSRGPARGAAPSPTRRARRRARSSVLPVPAAPTISSGPSPCAMARSRSAGGGSSAVDWSSRSTPKLAAW